MEFIKIESKCKEDINATIRCEFCGNTEMVYGKDTDNWYRGIVFIHCIKCRKSTEDEKSTNANDPYGVMNKLKYKDKRCEKCGKLVEITRYKCPCTGWQARGDNLETAPNPLDEG